MSEIRLTDEQQKEMMARARSAKEDPKARDAIKDFCKYWPEAKLALQGLEKLLPTLEPVIDDVLIPLGNAACGNH